MLIRIHEVFASTQPFSVLTALFIFLLQAWTPEIRGALRCTYRDTRAKDPPRKTPRWPSHVAKNVAGRKKNYDSLSVSSVLYVLSVHDLNLPFT